MLVDEELRDDAHDVQEEQSQEDEVFDQFAECVGSLLKSFHGAILPSLQKLITTYVVPMLDQSREPEERRIAICVFDDVVTLIAIAADQSVQIGCDEVIEPVR